MIVFGDAAEAVEVRARLGEITCLAEQAEAEASRGRWLATEAFIDAAALAQGLIDAEFESLGQDADSPMRDAATGLVLAAARLLTGQTDAEALRQAAAALRRLDLPERVACKRAEGYAFYALYPEAYLAAARALPAPLAAAIGIRSIGLGLAALLAAATNAAELLSVRPIGHPFRRRLSLSPGYRSRFAAGAGPIAVADEGPGLSGSSFSAVVDELAAAGVPERRIHLFPSHAGNPGPEASAQTLARWGRLKRHVIGFDDLFLGESPSGGRLESWFADLAGPPAEPLADISGGAWRDLRPWRDMPPAHMQQERRKFLLRTRQGIFLLKFVGLGRSGRAAARRARALGEAGFTPPFLGFRHGFLVERWVEGTPLGEAGLSRMALIGRLAAYLGFRARRLPAGSAPGASPDELARMLEINGVEAFGTEVAPALARLAALRPAHAGRKAMTDNRLHAWEWLLAPEGRLLKTDAVDHCAAHDLIGCQDIAWDVAGATLELALSADERRDLLDRLRCSEGVEVDQALLAFFDCCYPAFQLGYYAMAAAALAGASQEQERLQARAGFYREALRAKL